MQAKVNDSINFRQTSTTINNIMVENKYENARKLLKEKNRTNVIIDEMSKSFSRHNEDSREQQSKRNGKGVIQSLVEDDIEPGHMPKSDIIKTDNK
jgi:hypothetical protein